MLGIVEVVLGGIVVIVVIGRNRRCSGKSSSPMTTWNSRRNSANSSRWRGVEGVCGGEGIVGRVIGTLGLVRMVVEIIGAVAGKGRGVVGGVIGVVVGVLDGFHVCQ